MVASVGRITAGAGYDYLTKEVATSKHDYYTGAGEAPGQWTGRGAELLGLAGEVDADDMAALYGRFVVPSTAGGTRLPSGRWEPEQILGRKVSNRVRSDGTVIEPTAALDVTFSPSKSVSVLWALASDERVRTAVTDAHEAAVATALARSRRSRRSHRTGAGGVRQIASGGFRDRAVQASHGTVDGAGERVGDPQLHSHCATLNRARGVDGVWRTLDSRAIYRQAHAAGAVYAAALERLLSERLGVSWETPADRTPMRDRRHPRRSPLPVLDATRCSGRNV
ncbi:MAG: MobF family relaxase [Ilumatobacteraceae bacterium]